MGGYLFDFCDSFAINDGKGIGPLYAVNVVDGIPVLEPVTYWVTTQIQVAIKEGFVCIYANTNERANYYPAITKAK
jgi:hypothetical protein